jgi:radical SAM PhpK family P-methyltransferase
MSFQEYEKQIQQMGLNSGAYRDLNLNFLRFDGTPYSISEIFNIMWAKTKVSQAESKPFSVSESFNNAIAYLGSYLDKNGLTFDYIHSFQDEKAELAGKLQKNNILTIAIITTLYVSVFPILEIIKFIKKYNQTARIIVGGPFISTQFRNQTAESLQYLLGTTIGADIYVNSPQGEATLVKTIQALKSNLPLNRVNNLFYKDGDHYFQTPPKKENNKLEHNMVNWELFSDRMKEYINIRTSISCPFSCGFCGFPEHAGEYQVSSVEAIERELNSLAKIKTIKSLHFIDDTFNVPPQRFDSILRMMIKNNFDFHWHSYFRCQYTNDETSKLMKESHCDGVFLGIESGSNQILRNMNKSADTLKYLKGIEILKKHGIITFGNFILGFPGETPETIQETLQFIEQSQLDFYRVQLWYGEPITPIYRQKEKYKIKGENFEWSHATMNSKDASCFLEDIFMTQRHPIWIPQYHFDFDNLWHLYYRGMTIKKIKKFLEIFNKGVREKLKNPSLKETSYPITKQLLELFTPAAAGKINETRTKKAKRINHSEAEFDL